MEDVIHRSVLHQTRITVLTTRDAVERIWVIGVQVGKKISWAVVAGKTKEIPLSSPIFLDVGII